MLNGIPKRTLSRREAQRCEDAAEPECKCRCGGANHGGKRGDVGGLPFGDPHSIAKVKCGDVWVRPLYGGHSMETPCSNWAAVVDPRDGKTPLCSRHATFRLVGIS